MKSIPYEQFDNIYAIAYNWIVRSGGRLNAIFNVLRMKHFEEWFREQDEEVQARIQMRIDHIAFDGHFGWIHYFDGIIELKWKSGLRIYTARIGQALIVVLGGGTKHGQRKDIKKAKKLLEEVKESGLVSS